jgi:5-methylcytosine-specific restriction enzyme subunit McrC
MGEGGEGDLGRVTAARVIELVEHVPTHLAFDELSQAEAELLWRRFDKHLEVEYPSPRSGQRWRLTPKSSVGYLPVTPELGIAVRPKLEVRSVFAMLEYAYDLKSFQLFDGLHACSALEELFERVAVILARRVRGRVRRGVYRAYQPEHDRLPYVRGRLDIPQLVAAPWRAALACRFEEHTADVEDNRLLLWALHVAVRSGICTEPSSRHVLEAYRSLAGSVSLMEYEPSSYVRRRYQRLNEDYEPMHALGRFIVEHASPRHVHGAHAMVPFLLDMNRLYERFVAAWLHEHLPANWSIEQQDHLSFGTGAGVQFIADLLIRDRATREPIVVLDTKYKRDVRPSSNDLAQVAAYATAWGTEEAVLVYPAAPEPAWQARVGRVRVRALTFSVSGDLDAGGRRFLEALSNV